MKAISCIAIAGLVAGSALAVTPDDRPTTQQKTAKSALVFEGTVKALKKSNVRGVQESDSTVVVTVDRVAKGTEAASGLKGQDVTVILSKPLGDHPFEVGQRAVFYAEANTFANNLAVDEVFPADKPAGATKDTPKLVQAIGAQATVAASDQAEAALKDHLDTAHTVVFGKVTSVQPVESKDVASPKTKVTRPREHSADWHVAEVQVRSVEKGKPNQKKIRVVFANSKDFAYRDTPKFAVNQEGTFVLHKDQPGTDQVRPMMAAAPPGGQPETYTALSPLDFYPARPDHENLAKVRRLLGKK